MDIKGTMQFEIGNTAFDCNRTVIMGVLNVTPDSFYDGGKYFDRKRAVEHVLEMVEEGADIIDIGGESSRPGAEPVLEEDELKRVIPVIEAVASRISVPISIDTYRANVAKQAIEAGAGIINDISALRFDPQMIDVVRNNDVSIIFMHMLGNPQSMQVDPRYVNVVEDILGFLKERVAFAVAKGIPQARIIVDPGIGFGKTLEHNLEIIRNCDRFHETGCPVLIGVSHKSMIGKITGSPVEERLWGTAAITAYCVINGIEIHRVHDVKAMRQVCDVAAAICSCSSVSLGS
ncbi:dihydropteroate synthase [Candidatus Latescibacterota bacterium]